jgi:hypothetical protein
VTSSAEAPSNSSAGLLLDTDLLVRVQVQAQIGPGQQVILGFSGTGPADDDDGAFECRRRGAGVYACLVAVDDLIPGARYELTPQVVGPSSVLDLLSRPARGVSTLLSRVIGESDVLVVTRAPEPGR